MKHLVLILITFLTIGCAGEWDEQGNMLLNPETEKSDTYKSYPKIEHGQTFTSVDQIVRFVAINITHKQESKNQDHWQSPWETWELKTGDCEDFCILSMWLLKTELNIDSELIALRLEPSNHAIIKVNNQYIETKSAFVYRNAFIESQDIYIKMSLNEIISRVF